MNCLLCMDKLFICETCDAPWPCAKDDAAAGVPCACNPEVKPPPGFKSIALVDDPKAH